MPVGFKPDLPRVDARPERRSLLSPEGAVMAKKDLHTLPHGNAWANRREGSKRVSKVFKTKAEAQAAGRKTALREKVEHHIHNLDGKISERNSYGNDPARSQG